MLVEFALVPPPLTLSPTTPLTVATVPAAGARSAVSLSVRWADWRATSACSTDARSCASVAGDAVDLTRLLACVDFSASFADATCCSAVPIACRSLARPVSREAVAFAIWLRSESSFDS